MKKMHVTQEQKRGGLVEKCFYDKDQDAYLCRVEWDKVEVDYSYGRKHDQRHSDRMALNPLRIRSYPILSYRNHKLFSVDGQHRKEAEKKKYKKVGLSLVTFDLTQQQESILYDELNKVKNQNLWQRFKARLQGGDKQYLRIHRTIKDMGFTTRINAKWGEADLNSAYVILEADDRQLLIDWLEVLQAFQYDDGTCCRLDENVRKSIEFQRGLLDFVKEYRSDSYPAFVRFQLRSAGASGVLSLLPKNNCRASRKDFFKALEQIVYPRRGRLVA